MQVSEVLVSDVETAARPCRLGILRFRPEGRAAPVKKAIRVTFHKEKTDSYGRPHKVPVKTVYITGVKDKEAAQAAAVKRLEEEKGSGWTRVVNSVEAEEEPDSTKKQPE